MSDDVHVVTGVLGSAPSTSLEVAQAVLRSGDGSLPSMLGVGRGEPAFLLPASPRVGAAVCRSFNGLRPRRRRWQRSGVALALRVGAAAAVGSAPTDRGFALEGMPGSASLIDALGDQLGTPVLAGVGLGTLDAYWKPVLQLFDGSGAPVGFAKVGWTPMTRALVDNEWAVLTRLDGRLVDPVVPRPLLRLDHGPLRVVVTAPLPPDSRRMADRAVADVPESMTHLDGAARAVLADLAWWSGIREAVHDVDASGPSPVPLLGAPGLPELVAEVESRLGARPLSVGLVHGDWVPWNQARRRRTGRLVVWDWEYADLRAPLGLDAVHGRYQGERLLLGRGDAEAFALAHAGTDPDLAALHAALVAARRCRALTLGARDRATVDELRAAVSALRTAVTRLQEGHR